MKIHFLGTAAAEGWPGVFCRCEYCQKARQLGGPNIRTRSSALIDEVLKIDFPPDTYHHVLRDHLDLAKVEDLLITHTHSDHLYTQDLTMRRNVFAHGIDHPLRIHGHDAALKQCQTALGKPGDLFSFHLIQPFKSIKVGEAMVTPLVADHDPSETCLIYYIEKDGKRILYGHDTGWFPDQTWAWLEDKRFDLAILDCTHGPLPGRRNHMNIEAVVELRELFRDKNMLTDNGQVIATHFSHNGGLLHDELVDTFAPHDIEVAYDGMVVEI